MRFSGQHTRPDREGEANLVDFGVCSFLLPFRRWRTHWSGYGAATPRTETGEAKALHELLVARKLKPRMHAFGNHLADILALAKFSLTGLADLIQTRKMVG